MNNLLIILRCIATGDKTIFQNPDGSYTAIQCKGTSLVEPDAEEREIISRLQYELYGEYPLSEQNYLDWLVIIKSFNLNRQIIF